MSIRPSAISPNRTEMMKILSEVFYVGSSAYLKALPAKQYLGYHRDSFRYLCNVAARYGIPTIELINFLNEIIEPYRNENDPHSIIEIGAGCGDFSFHLKIKGTDSGIQDTPEMEMYYKSIGQTPIKPPSAIERIDGVEAVKKYKPKVVVASWVTQKFDATKGDVEGAAQAFSFGVDEEEMFELGIIEKYIFIGNIDQHGKKRILKYPHIELQFPWIVSRAANQCNNRIWIWDLKGANK